MEEFWALQTFAGYYVCAEGGGGIEVVANRPAVGIWEIFRITRPSDGAVALQAFNGRFVCAENGGGTDIRANRFDIGPWETFRVLDVRPSPERAINLRSSNGRFLCAENGGGGALVANRNRRGPWERFVIRHAARGDHPAKPRPRLAMTD